MSKNQPDQQPSQTVVEGEENREISKAGLPPIDFDALGLASDDPRVIAAKADLDTALLQQQFAILLKEKEVEQQQQIEYKRLFELRQQLKESEPSKFEKQINALQNALERVSHLKEPILKLKQPLTQIHGEVKKKIDEIRGSASQTMDKYSESASSLKREAYDVSEKVIEWPPRKYREAILGPTLYDILMQDPLDDFLKRPGKAENYCDLVIAPVGKARPARKVLNKVYREPKKRLRADVPRWSWYDLFLGPTVDNSYCTTLDIIRSLFSWGENKYVTIATEKQTEKIIDIINDLSKYRAGSLDKSIRKEEQLKSLKAELLYLESLYDVPPDAEYDGPLKDEVQPVEGAPEGEIGLEGSETELPEEEDKKGKKGKKDKKEKKKKGDD